MVVHGEELDDSCFKILPTTSLSFGPIRVRVRQVRQAVEKLLPNGGFISLSQKVKSYQSRLRSKNVSRVGFDEKSVAIAIRASLRKLDYLHFQFDF